MKCPTCNSDNLIGAIYCAACGERLEVTDQQARLQAMAEVTQAKWERSYKTLGRGAGIMFLVCVALLLFRAYANRDVGYDFTPSAPVAQPPELTFFQPPIKQGLVPAPIAKAAEDLPEDSQNVDALVTKLTDPARERLFSSVTLKAGGNIRGILWERTEREVILVVEWGPPVRTRTISLEEIDLAKSRLPQ